MFLSSNEEIEKVLTVKGMENESKSVIRFLTEKGERFHFNEESGKYYINSFYPSVPSHAWNRFMQGFSDITKEIRRVPVQADIVVTGKCHCKCWHCFRIKDRREDLSLQEIKSCFKDLYDLGTGTVGITGGEPMLRSDIKDIISMIPDGIEGQLYTTGHNITEEFADFLKKTNLTRVIISLDHYQEDIACEMRHYNQAFEEAVNAIKILVSKGIYTAVTVCITDNLLKEEEIKKYFDFISSLKADEMRVIMPIPQGNLEGKRVGKLYSNAVKFVKQQKKIYERNTDYPQILNFCEFESAGYIGCSAGANYISINNDGLVTPCVAVPLSFGNIRNYSLKKIFDSMEKYFPKSGRICYGKISGRIISQENIDTMVTPINIEESERVAKQCRKSTRRAAFFECFE